MRVGLLIGPELRDILREAPEQLEELLEEVHPEDVADVVAELPEEEAAKILSRIQADDAALIFERLEDETQEAIVEHMAPESVAHIAAEMAPDDRADLFEALDDEMSSVVYAKLKKVDPEAAEEVEQLDQWPEHSAGRLMTTDYIKVPSDATVDEAIMAIRHSGKAETIYYVYILTDRNELLGVVSLRDILLAELKTRMIDIARENVITVTPTLDQEEVAKRMAKYDLNALPVVNNDGLFLGIITVDDVMDVLTEEQTEDVQRLGAVVPLEESYFATTFPEIVRKRATWLIVLFVGEFFTATALRSYEKVLEAVTTLAFYVPLLISTGGNSGGQSTSLVIRGMAVGEIKLTDWWRVLIRELSQGIVLGLILAIVGFMRVYFAGDGVALGIVIAVTLIGIVTMGCTVGSMLPILLKRFKLDPATSSAPFIASLVDVLGILIYFNVAKILLAEVISKALAK